MKAIVGIVMGSKSDLEVMKDAGEALSEFGIEYEMRVISAHRTPEIAHEYSSTAKARGLKVIIAAAGGAAHLAGVMAASTTLPVLGVPIASSPLGGFDALLSTAQMPPGVPVATMSVGSWGARNAGIFAAMILATNDMEIAGKLAEFKLKQAEKIVQHDKEIQGS
ncbi:MAG: 5-(carboxyamino)imidazole ribonucleotide mutase [Planctomycetes bacterium]|nr:5-(carboxyamino)imidazole ribonucleotide mutase [Planctomycetota bacterium]